MQVLEGQAALGPDGKLVASDAGDEDAASGVEVSAVVRIVENPDPSLGIADIKRQLAPLEKVWETREAQLRAAIDDAKARLDRARTSLDAAKAREDQLASRTYTVEDTTGRIRNDSTRQVNDTHLANARAATERAEGEHRAAASAHRDAMRDLRLERGKAMVEIRPLKRELRMLQAKRVIRSETLDSRALVEIHARGMYMPLAERMQVGEVYEVTGRGRLDDASGGRIMLRGAVPQ